jgi:hypothetical protein
MTYRSFSKPTLLRALFLKRSAKPSASAEVKTLSFLPMTMRAVPSEYAHPVARNISFATAKNTGLYQHPTNGGASSVAQRPRTSESAFHCLTMERFAGCMSGNVALSVAFWAASQDGRSAIPLPNTCSNRLRLLDSAAARSRLLVIWRFHNSYRDDTLITSRQAIR